MWPGRESFPLGLGVGSEDYDAHAHTGLLAEQCPEKGQTDLRLCGVERAIHRSPYARDPWPARYVCVMRGQGAGIWRRGEGMGEERSLEEKKAGGRVGVAVWVVFNSGTSMINASGWLVVSSLSSSTAAGVLFHHLGAPPLAL